MPITIAPVHTPDPGLVVPPLATALAVGWRGSLGHKDDVLAQRQVRAPLWAGRQQVKVPVGAKAGGLGIIGAGGINISEIEEEARLVKQQTDKPFGINVPLQRPDAGAMIKTTINGGASVIATSAGSPKKFTRLIQDRGCWVLYVVANVTFTQKSAAAGVDAIVDRFRFFDDVIRAAIQRGLAEYSPHCSKPGFPVGRSSGIILGLCYPFVYSERPKSRLINARSP